MTERSMTPAVQAIVDDALAPMTPDLALRRAVTLLKTEGWKGTRKLSRDEALAATRTVTSMLQRFGLTATRVLQKDGRATNPGATYPFFLTEKEMAEGPKKTRRICVGLAAHMENVLAVAVHARSEGRQVDDTALLRELAEAVPEFLEQFYEKPPEEWDVEIATDVRRIAPWLAHPSRPFELLRCLVGADSQDLDYRKESGEMVHLGEAAGMFNDGLTPSVPLLTRIVARTDAEILVRDEAELAMAAQAKDWTFFPDPKLHLIGRAHCIICEKVGMGVVAERGSLRMVFTLDPVTFSGLPEGGLDDPHWDTRGYRQQLERSGIPIQGEAEPSKDGLHWIRPVDALQYECSEFEVHHRGLLDDDSRWDFPALLSRRTLPVTPEACRLLLSGGEWGDFEVWRTFTGITWETVLPTHAVDDAGYESRTIQKRFAALLYAETEPSLAGLLKGEATIICDAYDAFLMKSASGDQRRKQAFRARMRR